MGLIGRARNRRWEPGWDCESRESWPVSVWPASGWHVPALRSAAELETWPPRPTAPSTTSSSSSSQVAKSSTDPSPSRTSAGRPSSRARKSGSCTAASSRWVLVGWLVSWRLGRSVGDERVCVSNPYPYILCVCHLAAPAPPRLVPSGSKVHSLFTFATTPALFLCVKR
jgi:hypothetical protein